MTGQDRHQLLRWCELLIEDRLDSTESQRFEQLILADAEARGLYLEYITLHGLLTWDTAAVGLDLTHAASSGPVQPRRPLVAAGKVRIMTSIAAVILVAVAALLLRPLFQQPGGAPNIADDAANDNTNEQEVADNDSENEPITPITLPDGASDDADDDSTAIASTQADENAEDDHVAISSHLPPSTKLVVEAIDSHMAVIWEDYEVEESPVADDAEWLRRCYLDLVGHIPPAEAVTAFVDDPARDKRARVVDELLEGSGHTRHLATVWTNLLVGRRPRPQADRDALAKFLRDQFHSNAPWSETVAAMLTAEGRSDENPASNFLLAHLNNQAVPATAVACRLFLGQQMQCAQCHKHPDQGWDQERFWQLNACFQQTDIAADQEYNPQTGTMQTVAWRLTEEPASGPTYYEDMRGVVHAAYPGLDGAAIDDDESTNRRDELMQLLLADDEHQMAAAFVNRTWAHVFGYGLVNPVDDLGPHTSSIHSQLLDDLSAAFVASGYNVRELYRWICLSQPYQLSSEFSEANAIDDPAGGEQPLFSRTYLRSLSPEQLFDSLVVATSAGEAGAADWDEVDARRKEWAHAFYQPAQTDDNAELSTFDDSYSQALVLMNGDLVQSALEPRPGSLLFDVMTEEGTDYERIERLWLATLSRRPTRDEMAGSRRLVQQAVQLETSQGAPRELAQANSMADVLWALLNSSEFSVIH